MCVSPLWGYRAAALNASGKRSITFDYTKSVVFGTINNKPTIPLPCGKCIECRLKKSREWAMRCMHEAQMHEENTFITLTYNQKHLPPGGKEIYNPRIDKTYMSGALRKDHFQLFMKRLRKKYCEVRYTQLKWKQDHEGVYRPTKGRIRTYQIRKIRYLHCGEYGGGTQRPHYHAIIFGFKFPDEKYLKKSPSGHPLHTSASLDELWHDGNGDNLGFAWTGSVTFDSCAYVARYITKKINESQHTQEGKKMYEDKYLNKETGELLQPEYITMSRRKGIGYEWYQKYKNKEVYPEDYIIEKGMKLKPPKYYDRLFEDEDPELFELIKKERARKAKELTNRKDQPSLESREKVLLNNMKIYKQRSYEHDGSDLHNL